MRRMCLGIATALLVACASDDGGGNGPDRSNTDTGGRVDATEDVANADAAADTAQDTAVPDTPSPDLGTPDTPTADTGGGEDLYGGVAVFEIRAPDVDDLNTGGLGASFDDEPAADATPVATIGDCIITMVDSSTDPFATGPSLDAGTISVTASAETHTLTRSTGADPRYTSSAPEGRDEFFVGGETITYEATGGADVPAFSGTTPAPEEPALTAPSWSGLLGGSHDAAQPLAVAWSGAAGNGDFVISILPITTVPEPGIATGNAVTCTVADTGTFAVPAEALAYLPAGGGFGPNVALTVARTSNSVIGAGSTTVTLNATASHTIVGTID